MARGQAQGIVRELRRFSARRCARIALICGRTLAGPPPVGTPRDTHLHSANWIAQIGSRFEGVVGEEIARAARSNRRSGRSRDEAGRFVRTRVPRTEQNASFAAIEQGYRDTSQGPIYLSNNGPAIVRLNDGYSRQSPSAFVQRAIRLAVSQADRELGGRAGRFRR